MIEHFGLAIDQNTNDLYLDDDGNLAVSKGAQAVAEHVRQRLMTYQAEWFLDNTAGVPWLDQIMGKAYDSALSEALVKAEILNTDAVTEITSFSVGFLRMQRNLVIKDVEILTSYDVIVSV